MSIIATAVKHMMDAGMPRDTIIAAIAAMEAELTTQGSRSKAAIRQANYREHSSISTAEWNELRYVVFERDRFVCVYCGVYTERPQCDHVIPRSRGGPNTEDNLATACKPCNSSKRNKTPEEWLS